MRWWDEPNRLQRTMLLSKLPQLGSDAAVPLIKDVHVRLEDSDVRAGGLRNAQHLLHCAHIGRHRQVAALARHELKQPLAARILRQPCPLLEWQSAGDKALELKLQPALTAPTGTMLLSAGPHRAASISVVEAFHGPSEVHYVAKISRNIDNE